MLSDFPLDLYTILRPDFAETGKGWEIMKRENLYDLPELQGVTHLGNLQSIIDFLEDVYGYRIRVGVCASHLRGEVNHYGLKD